MRKHGTRWGTGFLTCLDPARGACPNVTSVQQRGLGGLALGSGRAHELHHMRFISYMQMQNYEKELHRGHNCFLMIYVNDIYQK
jgi:hypothetical protein